MKKVINILYYVLFGFLALALSMFFIRDLVECADFGYYESYGLLGLSIFSFIIEILSSAGIVAISVYCICKRAKRSISDKRTLTLSTICFNILSGLFFVSYIIANSYLSKLGYGVRGTFIVSLVFVLVSLGLFVSSYFIKAEKNQLLRLILTGAAILLLFVTEIVLTAYSDGIVIAAYVLLLLASVLYGFILFALYFCKDGVDGYFNESFLNPKEQPHKNEKVEILKPDPYEELKKLHELLDSGIITQEIYDEKAQKYIDQL